MNSPFWQVVKKLGILLAAVLAAIQVASWWNGPTLSLTAVVQSGEAQLPPTLNLKLQQFEAGLSSEELIKLAGPQFTESTKDAVGESMRKVSIELGSRLRDLMREDDWEFTGITNATVANEGTTALSTVRIRIPFAQVVQVATEDKIAKVRPVEEMVDLGTLQPGEIVQVRAWSKFSIDDAYQSQFRLTHDQGIGDISFRVRTSTTAQWLERIWVPLLLISFIFLSVVIAGIGSHVQSARDEFRSALKEFEVSNNERERELEKIMEKAKQIFDEPPEDRPAAGA